MAGRTETYPWSTLEQVGDYFVVMTEFKPYTHMNAVVHVRNAHVRGKMKYSCNKTTYGCIVMVTQVSDHMPPYDVEIVDGLRGLMRRIDGTSEQKLGNRPETRELTIEEKVNRMSPAMRESNLPWWYDPGNGKLIWNGKVATRADTAKYIDEGWRPSKTEPYPEHYNLDSNLVIREVFELEEEEDFGDHPIFDSGDQLGEIET